MTDSTSLLVVRSHPVEGREEEYHKWYDHQHLGDVCRVPGVTGARRYTTGNPEDGFLAIYELDGDPGEVMAEIGKRAGSGEMPISDAMDASKVELKVWSLRS